MADPPPPQGMSAQASAGSGLVIPPGMQEKFGELLGLIRASESMNDEERQYWVNILPIMTPEQIQNLRDILENERKQLAAIDAKYATNMQGMNDKEQARKTEEDRRKRRATRSSAEASHKEKEEEHTENILKQIEGAS